MAQVAISVGQFLRLIFLDLSVSFDIVDLFHVSGNIFHSGCQDIPLSLDFPLLH